MTTWLRAADEAALRAHTSNLSDIPPERQAQIRGKFRIACDEARTGIGHGDWTSWLADRAVRKHSQAPR